MTDRQRKFAVKLFQERIKENPDYSEREFASELLSHIEETNGFFNKTYDPFSMNVQIDNLWKVLNMYLVV